MPIRRAIAKLMLRPTIERASTISATGKRAPRCFTPRVIKLNMKALASRARTARRPWPADSSTVFCILFLLPGF